MNVHERSTGLQPVFPQTTRVTNPCYFALLTAIVAALLGTAIADTYTPGEPIRGEFKDFAQGFLEKHCFECHDDVTTKGNLSLLDLGPLDETNVAVWKSVWAQVTLQEMPPKQQSQPDIVERLRFSDWVVNELQREMEDKGGFQCPPGSQQRQLRRSRPALRPAARWHSDSRRRRRRRASGG